jgi:hypothetical protein
MTHPRFPLSSESYYRFGLNKETQHTDPIWLSVAQRALRVRWRFKDVYPTGWFDAATSAAVCRVQQAIGRRPDGELDEETWDAIFTKNMMDPP